MPLTDRQVIHRQARVVKSLRDRIVRMKERAERTIKFCRENSYTPSKLAEDIVGEAEAALTYLDLRSAEMKEAMDEVSRDQTRLMGDVETPKVRR